MKVVWVPTTHMLADKLTKVTGDTPVFERFMKMGLYCLTQTEEEQEAEKYRKELRQGQRQRRKERKLLAKGTVLP